jgi:hypothetical protein
LQIPLHCICRHLPIAYFSCNRAVLSHLDPLSENQKNMNRHYSGHKSYLCSHKSCIICTLSFLKKINQDHWA